mgnify:CR=1 FL=1
MIRTGIFFIKRINDILFRFLAGSRIYRQNDRNINLFFSVLRLVCPVFLPHPVSTVRTSAIQNTDCKYFL